MRGIPAHSCHVDKVSTGSSVRSTFQSSTGLILTVRRRGGLSCKKGTEDGGTRGGERPPVGSPHVSRGSLRRRAVPVGAGVGSTPGPRPYYLSHRMW